MPDEVQQERPGLVVHDDLYQPRLHKVLLRVALLLLALVRRDEVAVEVIFQVGHRVLQADAVQQFLTKPDLLKKVLNQIVATGDHIDLLLIWNGFSGEDCARARGNDRFLGVGTELSVSFGILDGYRKSIDEGLGKGLGAAYLPKQEHNHPRVRFLESGKRIGGRH